jgi:GTP cyclohydrolase FolE2
MFCLEQCPMKARQSEQYRQNAQNCAEMAEHAKSEPTYKRLKRMEEAWLALADEQDWLDGQIHPLASGPATV